MINKMTDHTIYRVPEVLKILRCGRTKFYRMVETGKIEIHKLGGSTVVKQESLNRFMRENPASAVAETPPEPAEVLDDGRVYFIDDGFFIKIGFSKKPQDRIGKLQTASPFKLMLMRTIPGNKKLEAELHARFRHLKSHGEWFRGERELRQHIRSIPLPETGNDKIPTP